MKPRSQLDLITAWEYKGPGKDPADQGDTGPDKAIFHHVVRLPDGREITAMHVRDPFMLALSVDDLNARLKKMKPSDGLPVRLMQKALKDMMSLPKTYGTINRQGQGRQGSFDLRR